MKLGGGWVIYENHVEELVPILTNILNVDESSTWADYTLDHEGRLSELVLNVFTSTEEKKQKLVGVIKSTSFLTTLNEKWRKKSTFKIPWLAGFTVGSASDPIAEPVKGKTII